jgi:hypothetical protein
VLSETDFESFVLSGLIDEILGTFVVLGVCVVDGDGGRDMVL